jgi:hypothetical protein
MYILEHAWTRCAVSSSRGIFRGKKGIIFGQAVWLIIYQPFNFNSDNSPIQPLDFIILQGKTNQFPLAKICTETVQYVCSFVKRPELVTDRPDWLVFKEPLRS